MYNHAPHDYACPFCTLAHGRDAGGAYTRQEEIIYRDDHTLAFISSHQWPNNKGHAVVVPAAHYENIYDLPLELATRIHAVVQSLALAMKRTYQCEGISTRQHNEPAGNQDVWHYHLHVFPRYAGDQLYRSPKELMPFAQRLDYARRLQEALATPDDG